MHFAIANHLIFKCALSNQRRAFRLPELPPSSEVPSMSGYLSILLHAHLPFVRHAEHERFLEESWLYEAIIECYLPMLEIYEGWIRDNIPARITMVLSPTLCAMLQDPLLNRRFKQRIEQWISLSEREILRTRLEPDSHRNAQMYCARFQRLRQVYERWQGNLIEAFKHCERAGAVELITCGATHAVLPLWTNHPRSLRAQIETAILHHERCFGVRPAGFWLPECAYAPAVEPVLKEFGVRWFPLETHGLTRARPLPRHAPYAPIITPTGLAAFGRDPVSAEQVWSRAGGYPGDPWYRDFYRDIGFDLDLDYTEPFLPTPGKRGFTGLKYCRVTGPGAGKEPYLRAAALARIETHAAHFLQQRAGQLRQLSETMEAPPIIMAPYDAELFGHWWFEGPEFLDAVARQAVQAEVPLRTPTDYLRESPRHEAAAPSASSWGEEGYWRVWLNDTNAWIYPQLLESAEKLEQLIAQYGAALGLPGRALRLAIQELMLLQASDWPFIMRAGTHASYARERVKNHQARFKELARQFETGQFEVEIITQWERLDLLFPGLPPIRPAQSKTD